MRLLRFPLDVLRSRAGRPTRPRMLTYIVTYTCNARCTMCDSWRIPSPDDLSLEEIARVFRQLPRLDVVRLTGGEPFVRRDLDEIAVLVTRHLSPFLLHVTTNGFLTDRVLQMCESLPRRQPLHVLVSIDGHDTKHDEVRGVPRAWERSMETVRALSRVRAGRRLSVSVNQTIVDRDGLEHYRLLRDELAPLGVRNQVVLAYKESATYSTDRGRTVDLKEGKGYDLHGEFTAAELRALLDELAKDLHRLPLPERVGKRYYLDGLRRRLLDGAGTGPPRCVALGAHMRLYPNGDVPTCQFDSRVVGNLREQSFEDVWRNARADAQREIVRRCPGCWAECEVLPNAIYSGELARSALRWRGRGGRAGPAPLALATADPGGSL